MKKILIVISLLLIFATGFSQGIAYMIPMEYRIAMGKTDSTIWCRINNSQYPIQVTLPGGIKCISAYGGFNAIMAIGTDGKVYINKNDGTTNWSQVSNASDFSTDTTGAIFNNNKTIICYADTYTTLKNDGSVWYWGTDKLKIIYSSGAVSMKPMQISPPGMVVKKLVMGGTKIIALTTSGDVYEWTYNQHSATPTKKTIPAPAIDIFVSHLDYAGCIIPAASPASQTMGYPYVWGNYFGAWMGNTSYVQPTSVKTLWGVTYPIKTIDVNWNTTHYTDSLDRLFGLGFNVQGEVGNGLEYVNRVGVYSAPYSWDFADGEYPTGAPAQLIATGIKKIYSNNYFCFYKYFQDSAGNYLFCGRDKAMVSGRAFLNMQEQYSPNSMDLASLTITTPLTNKFQQYTFASPTLSAGSDQIIVTNSTTLTATGSPATLTQTNGNNNGIPSVGFAPATYQWVKLSGPSGDVITSPTAQTTAVTGLQTGSYSYQVVQTDANNGTIKDTVVVNATVATGVTYYIANAGNDGNNGTSSATPWQTLSKVNAQNFNPGDQILFNRGDVFFGQLKTTKNGTGSQPIIYAAYGTGAQPVISGYLTLSTWVNNGGGIYASAAPGIKQYARNLLLDGVQQPLARYPNSSYLTYTASTSTSITDPTLTGTPNYTGSGVIVKSSNFTLDTATIISQSTTVLNLGSTLSYTTAGGNSYFFQGDKRWLDTYGEWVVNSTLDSAYLFFGGGGSSGHTIKVGVIDTLCLATGSYLNFNGLHFTGGNMYNFFSAFGAGNININQCTFDNGFNGLQLNTIHNSITNSQIQNFTSNGITGTINGTTKYLSVISDTINNIGTMPGMGGSGAGGTYEAINNPADSCYYGNNEIGSIGYTVLYLAGNNSAAKYNHIFNFCNVKTDGGGIYTWNSTAPTYTVPLAIVGNYISGGVGAQAHGIYLDGHSKTALVDSNTLVNNGGNGIFNHGNSHTITNNIVYGNGSAQIYLSEFAGNPITGTIIKYNTLASPDSTKPAISYYTPGTDITTMGVADSNYYAAQSGAVKLFRTQSTGDAGTLRSFANWKNYLNTDPKSTYQTGGLSFVSNLTRSSIVYQLPGRYQDMRGTTYNTIPLAPLSGAILIGNCCTLKLQFGTKVNFQ